MTVCGSQIGQINEPRTVLNCILTFVSIPNLKSIAADSPGALFAQYFPCHTVDVHLAPHVVIKLQYITLIEQSFQQQLTIDGYKARMSIVIQSL